MLHQGEQKGGVEDSHTLLAYRGGKIQFFKSYSTLKILTYLKIPKLNITKRMCPLYSSSLWRFSIRDENFTMSHWNCSGRSISALSVHIILSNIQPLGNWCSFHCNIQIVCENFVLRWKIWKEGCVLWGYKTRCAKMAS